MKYYKIIDQSFRMRPTNESMNECIYDWMGNGPDETITFTNWDHIHEYILDGTHLVGITPSPYAQIHPDSHHDYVWNSTHVFINGDDIFHSIPEEIYLRAIHTQYLLPHHLPEIPQTQAICLASVKQNGMALRYIQPQFQTPEVCMAAIHQNGWSYLFVKNLTDEMIVEAIYQDKSILLAHPEYISQWNTYRSRLY